jgi:hypothetical protein
MCYMFIHKNAYTYTCVYMHICTRKYIIYMYIYANMYAYTWIYIYMHEYEHGCVYIHLFIFIYTHRIYAYSYSYYMITYLSASRVMYVDTCMTTYTHIFG